MERRYVNAPQVRASADGRRIGGYAAVFNQQSEDLGDFREVVLPGAFSRCLASGPDVRCLFNHDSSQVLGRTKAGTLRLKEDAYGLYFDCDLPDNQLGRDLHESIRRGDVDQCSFGFAMRAQNWRKDGGGVDVRELMDVDLFDVSPVTFAAYPQTSVAARRAPDLTRLFPDGIPAEVRARKITPSGVAITAPPAPAPATLHFSSDAERLAVVARKLGVTNGRRDSLPMRNTMSELGRARLRSFARGEHRDLTTGQAAPFIEEEFSSMVVAAMRAYDPIFGLSTGIESDTGAPFDVFAIDDTQSQATIVGEASADSEQDPVPYVAKLAEAPTWDTGVVKISLALLDDSGVDFAALLAEAFGIRLARGVGASMIAQIVEEVSPGVQTALTDSFEYQDLLNLLGSVDVAYRNTGRCAWLMNQSTLTFIDGLKDSVGRPIITPIYVNGQRMLLGFPCHVSPSVPNFGGVIGATPVLFGPLNFFVLRTVKEGGQLIRLTERYIDTLQVGFKSFLRANGALMGIQTYTNTSPALVQTPIQAMMMGAGS